MRFILVLLFFVSTQAQAQVQNDDFLTSAESGINTEVIIKIALWETSCKRIRMTHSIVEKPVHGTVKQYTGWQVVSENLEVTRGSLEKCYGVNTTSSKFWYQSEPGFKGTDRFTIQSVWETGYVDIDPVIIEVK